MGIEPLTDRRGQFWVLVLASFAGWMTSADMNIVRLALPALSRDLHADAGLVSWVQLIYILVLTCSLLVFGKLGDTWGFKRLFVAGLVVFTIGSLGCTLAPHICALLAARAVQAFGGAAMMALATPLISTYLPVEQQGRALGIAAAWGSLGITLGRFLGGVIVEYLSWHWIFLINLPMGLIAIALAVRVLPLVGTKASTQRFDYEGAGLIFFMLGPLLLALSLGDKEGGAAPLIIGFFACTVLSSAAFWWRESRLADPLLDLSIFAHPNISLAMLTSFVKFYVEAGLYFLAPFYLMLSKKMPADMAGLLLVLPALVQMMISPTTGYLMDLMGSRWLSCLSMVPTLAACVLCYFFTPESNYFHIVLAITCIGLAKGLFIAPNRHRMMTYSPPGKMGSVNGVLETVNRAGIALGIASFQTMFSAYVPERGSAYLHAPEAVLEAGFRAAFLLGIIVSLVGLVSAAISVDRPDVVKEA